MKITMKQRLTKNDKRSLISGLKNSEYNLYELNHLNKDLNDHSGAIELFGDITLPLEPDDKRAILNSLQKGSINIDSMPLKERVEENFFLEIMKQSSYE